MEVRVVGLSSGKVKVWCVEVGKDGDGAFLGRGWPEFAAAQGVGAGWLLVLRHQGGGVLTVKMFDSSGCIRGLGTPPAVCKKIKLTELGLHVINDKNNYIQLKLIACNSYVLQNRRQTTKMLLIGRSSSLIPAKFVQHYIPGEHLDNRMAIVIGPLGKTCRVGLERNRSDLFFTAGWSQFLKSHDITEADALLLRYEGNMVFTVKVFGPNGCQIESKHKGIRMQQDIGKQQETPSESIRKSKSNKGRPIKQVQKKPERSVASYEIGPPSWIKKEINTVTLKRKLTLTKSFCDAIGLRKPCTITLKTSMDSAKSWQVGGIPCNNNSYVIARGWTVFCLENSLKEGDICTFSVIETTLWHVVIRRNNKEKRDQFCSLESPSASSTKLYSSKRKRTSDMSSSEGQQRPKGSMTSSKTRCVFEIGPPAWIKKEINKSTMENYFSLTPAFCHAIGLWDPCTITLKTSMSSTRSWQVRVVPYENRSHLGGPNWKRFCQENGIKVGDICTINIVEPTLWHVVVTRP
ncbi:hypothetical protein BS78_06G050800 [Paspalum vaginatum]|nr:hypothetical protein BS78_06G050800 [Paspalum vaginatum]